MPSPRAVVLAMGLENGVFHTDDGAGLGLTCVTGTLVKVGQLAAAAPARHLLDTDRRKIN